MSNYSYNGGDIGCSIDDSGLKTLKSKAKITLRRAVASGLNEWFEEIFAESQVLVPVDTGALKATGTFKPARMDVAFPTATISYGGSGVNYAYWVHENLYDIHAAPTQALFVAQPMLDHRRELDDILRHKIKMGWAKMWL